MVVIALTSRQHAAVEELTSARRIERVPADAVRAAAFLAAAEDRLGQLPLLSSVRVAYDLAYDAAHDVGEALLAGYGYRTRNGTGQHEAVGRFLQAILDSPPGADAARRYDRLRRARNRSHYGADVVGRADAEVAERTARALVAAARARGIGA